MSRDDEACLKLGREVARMIRDLQSASGSEAGYARRNITFPGGEVHLFVVNTPQLADVFEAAAAKQYAVVDVVPKSARN